jgi:poly-D-alanine transfer protein DltD
LITIRPLDNIVEQKIAKKYKVSPNTVRKAEKFANAIDEVANNANINPYKILGREIKGTRKDIVELSQKPAELQKEIIEKVEKKEIPNIKTALKEIEDEVIFDEIEEYPEINANENEYSSPFDLAEKIFDVINNYKKEYDDVDMNFIKNTLEIFNENLIERVKL